MPSLYIGVTVIYTLVLLTLFLFTRYGDWEYEDPPEEKRTYIFETENGEKYNPFDSLEGIESETIKCPNCGEPHNKNYKYCSNCSSRVI